jgi:hypothetical protein
VLNRARELFFVVSGRTLTPKWSQDFPQEHPGPCQAQLFYDFRLYLDVVFESCCCFVCLFPLRFGPKNLRNPLRASIRLVLEYTWVLYLECLIHISIHPQIHVSLGACVRISRSPYIPASMYRSVHICIYPYIHISKYHYFHKAIYPSTDKSLSFLDGTM